MMRALRLIYGAILMLLCIPGYAQKDWDDVLDRYELITERCIQLRSRITAGEAVMDYSVSELIGELGELRNMLKGASESMTPEQRMRFDSIKSRYEGKTTRQQITVHSPTKQKTKSTIVNAKRDTPPETLAERNVIKLLPAVSNIRPLALESFKPIALAPKTLCHPCQIPEERNPQWTFDLVFDAIFDAKPIPGLFLGTACGKWGGFISARSNFVSASSSYTTNSSGLTQNEARFWGNGSSRFSYNGITIGPLWCPLPWLSLYSGAGYAARILTWQDISGEWALVNDFSKHGLSFEAGCLVSLKRFDILTGVCIFNGISVSAGAGWRF
ncbi:MAG: hypothetical protein IKH11_07315 [Bacteroidales bacterium]|nr:hypothetical protein [Bacteroidales bacterium]